MIRWAALAAIVGLAAACSSAPPRVGALSGSHAALPSDRYIIVAVANEPTAFVAHAGSTPRGYEAIVDYGPSSRARRVMHSLETDYGLREVNAWPIEPLQMHCAVLQIPAGADRDALLAKLAKDPRVKLTQPMQTFATLTDGAKSGAYNDPYVGLQRGFQQMDVADAHPWSRGDGVKVAIIDTGADILHPDLRASIAGTENFVDSDEGQFRRDRHGTEMAGVIAAVANNREGIVGIAPGARLWILKACWQVQPDADAASCNSFTLARAIAAALSVHAQVVNMSFSGPDDPLLGDLIREGQRRGMLFVGAAAEASDLQNGLLRREGMIPVASDDKRSTLESALYAPGREILTLLPGAHYDFASGASIATAQVSGVVALMLAKDPGLSAGAAYRLLRETSTPLSAGGIKSVDACAAVVRLVAQASCPAAGIERAALDQHEPRVALH